MLPGRRHLRELLQDPERSDLLYHEHVSEHGTLIADFSRQRVTQETLDLLIKLADTVSETESCAAHCIILELYDFSRQRVTNRAAHCMFLGAVGLLAAERHQGGAGLAHLRRQGKTLIQM